MDGFGIFIASAVVTVVLVIVVCGIVGMIVGHVSQKEIEAVKNGDLYA